MKKLFKTIAIAALAAVCAGCVAAFAACGNNDDVVDTDTPATTDPDNTNTDNTDSGSNTDSSTTVTKEVLFTFTGTYCTIDCYNDGTYYFEFTEMPMASESGTWTWQNWEFTITTASGVSVVADMAGDDGATLTRGDDTITVGAYALYFTYVADMNEQLSDFFYADAATWGAALGTTGSYTPITSSDDGSSSQEEALVSVSVDLAVIGTVYLDFYEDSSVGFSYPSMSLNMTLGTWSVDESGALTITMDEAITETGLSISQNSSTGTVTLGLGSMGGGFIDNVEFTIDSSTLSTLGATSLAEIAGAAKATATLTDSFCVYSQDEENADGSATLKLYLADEEGGENTFTLTIGVYSTESSSYSTNMTIEGTWSISSQIVTLTIPGTDEGSSDTTFTATSNGQDEWKIELTGTANDSSTSVTITFTYDQDVAADLAGE